MRTAAIEIKIDIKGDSNEPNIAIISDIFKKMLNNM
jgi:hypothetical protein